MDAGTIDYRQNPELVSQAGGQPSEKPIASRELNLAQKIQRVADMLEGQADLDLSAPQIHEVATQQLIPSIRNEQTIEIGTLVREVRSHLLRPDIAQDDRGRGEQMIQDHDSNLHMRRLAEERAIQGILDEVSAKRRSYNDAVGDMTRHFSELVAVLSQMIASGAVDINTLEGLHDAITKFREFLDVGQRTENVPPHATAQVALRMAALEYSRLSLANCYAGLTALDVVLTVVADPPSEEALRLAGKSKEEWEAWQKTVQTERLPMFSIRHVADEINRSVAVLNDVMTKAGMGVEEQKTLIAPFVSIQKMVQDSSGHASRGDWKSAKLVLAQIPTALVSGLRALGLFSSQYGQVLAAQNNVWLYSAKLCGFVSQFVGQHAAGVFLVFLLQTSIYATMAGRPLQDLNRWDYGAAVVTAAACGAIAATLPVTGPLTIGATAVLGGYSGLRLGGDRCRWLAYYSAMRSQQLLSAIQAVAGPPARRFANDLASSVSSKVGLVSDVFTASLAGVRSMRSAFKTVRQERREGKKLFRTIEADIQKCHEKLSERRLPTEEEILGVADALSGVCCLVESDGATPDLLRHATALVNVLLEASLETRADYTDQIGTMGRACASAYTALRNRQAVHGTFSEERWQKAKQDLITAFEALEKQVRDAANGSIRDRPQADESESPVEVQAYAASLIDRLPNGVESVQAHPRLYGEYLFLNQDAQVLKQDKNWPLRANRFLNALRRLCQ